MPWHSVAAYFLGGVFLANFFPHFIAGMSGARFHTPFADPPFRGLSSPIVNSVYALLNLGIAYVLLVVATGLDLRDAVAVGVTVCGFSLWSLLVSRSVAKLRALSGS